MDEESHHGEILYGSLPFTSEARNCKQYRLSRVQNLANNGLKGEIFKDDDKKALMFEEHDAKVFVCGI